MRDMQKISHTPNRPSTAERFRLVDELEGNAAG